jgi:uncharacterized membrane protein YbhN (UPF0104 family)
MALGTFIALGTLLSQIGDPAQFWHRIHDADWLLVALALVLTFAADAVLGITFLGNVPVRIPLWPSIELQLAMAFSNLAVPIAADAAIQVRFLQKQGFDLPTATATGGVLSAVSEIGVQVALFGVALWLSPDTIDIGRIDTGRVAGIALLVLLVVGVAVAVVFAVRRLRQAVLPPVTRAAKALMIAVASPRRLGLLVVGNVVANLLLVASLLACLHAFGQRVDFLTLTAVYIGVGTIASLVPIPGGDIVVSSVGLAGALTALGVPHAPAAAAVLTFQVVHSYLPAIPGWFATNDLIRRQLL